MVRIIPPVRDHVGIDQEDRGAGLQPGGARVRETLFIILKEVKMNRTNKINLPHVYGLSWSYGTIFTYPSTK
jgi:hypothetical protein